jgi:hypothetical protein
MTSYFSTFVGYASAETRLDGAFKEFPVPVPEDFAKNPQAVMQLYKDVEDFATAPSAWRVRPTAIAPVYCMHDGVLASEAARDILRQPKILLLEASVTAAIGPAAAMQFTDINTATAALLLDGAYSTFAIMHGGGKMFTTFCWDTGDAVQQERFFKDIRTIYERIAKLRPEDSPFHNKPKLEADLEKQQYWQNFKRLPGQVLSRGIRVFKTAEAKELPGFDDLAASLGTKRAEKTHDLRQSIWDGIRDITGTLDRLGAAAGW